MKAQYQISTKCHYSWLRRGESCSVRNIKCSNSLNFISAITTKGDSISLLKYRTTKSDDIIEFIEVILKLFELKYEIGVDKVGIILDNWKTHRSKNLKTFYLKKSLKLYFIPAYSSELAPIETYFSRLKFIVIKEK